LSRAPYRVTHHAIGAVRDPSSLDGFFLVKLLPHASNTRSFFLTRVSFVPARLLFLRSPDGSVPSGTARLSWPRQRHHLPTLLPTRHRSTTPSPTDWDPQQSLVRAAPHGRGHLSAIATTDANLQPGAVAAPLPLRASTRTAPGSATVIALLQTRTRSLSPSLSRFRLGRRRYTANTMKPR
jgi:hypothetical protein